MALNESDLECLAKLWGYKSVRDEKFIELIAMQILCDGLESYIVSKGELLKCH